ncbi:ABC transporter ATP-binding protein [Propioniferax innocua]|uniref:Peptide/nickel transport system ATP-binding protein n=1 Tax=Propioniferax innocua TaxID=1753 RepID=A0A542ZBM9_9ACTN|nr:ABC transporter ATP-binding protein [Propioniferax innocua]TQL57745.1 peptide/nickel transport system ATP-binding protein [Propioniferax innocua]
MTDTTDKTPDTGQKNIAVKDAGQKAVADPQPLLDVKNLSVTFSKRKGESFTAVDGVDFDVRPGEVVGIVGESGSGKSVTSMAVMGLLPRRGVTIEGEARFDGTDLLTMPKQELTRLRGGDLAMVFQDPMSSLNPVVTIGKQMTEVLHAHRTISAKDARDEAIDLLRRCGIPDPARRFGEYPHQLSGGMRQRALIAIALACQPRLLICDEPTTALDVTIQAQVLELLTELVRDMGTAMIMITHDLGVVAGLCDHVNVMYAGRIVEYAPREALFASPRHRYTHGLIDSIPRLDQRRDQRLTPIPGTPADTVPWSRACAFAPRCRHVTDACVTDAIPLEEVGFEHRARCVNPASDAENSTQTSQVMASGQMAQEESE